MCETYPLADAERFGALQTLEAKRKSGGLGRYDCKRVKHATKKVGGSLDFL